MERKTYLSINSGKVVERLADTTKRASELNEDDVKRKYPECNRIREIIKDDVFRKTVFERLDDYVEGTILDIKIKTTDFGNQLAITMNDGTEEFIININEDTSNAISFMKIIPSADPNFPVKIRPWRNEKTKSEGLVLSQEGVKLNYYFSNDNPRGLPSPPEFAPKVDYSQWTPKQKNEYKIYKINRLTFLTEFLMEKVAPKFKDVDYSELPPSDDLGAEVDLTPIERPTKEPVDLETDSGDLPF